MTYEEKLVWLNRYREARKKLRHLQDQITEVQEQAEHITQSISPAPGGGSSGQALAVAVERKAALEQQADTLRRQLRQYYREIFDALRRSGLDPTDYIILHKRYLECRTWEKIAEDTCYTLRWVYARHRKAVDQLEL